MYLSHVLPPVSAYMKICLDELLLFCGNQFHKSDFKTILLPLKPSSTSLDSNPSFKYFFTTILLEIYKRNKFCLCKCRSVFQTWWKRQIQPSYLLHFLLKIFSWVHYENFLTQLISNKIKGQVFHEQTYFHKKVLHFFLFLLFTIMKKKFVSRKTYRTVFFLIQIK